MNKCTIISNNNAQHQSFSEIFKICHKYGPVDANMIQNHYHDFYEVYFFLGNEMSYFIESKTFRLSQYDMVFIDKFTYHKTKYKSNSSRERIGIQFDDSLLKMLGNSVIEQIIIQLFTCKRISFDRDFNTYLYNCFKNRLLPLYTEYTSTDSIVSLVKTKIIFLEILISIVEWLDKNVNSIKDTSFKTIKEERIFNVINYINDNFASDITLNFLSEEFFTDKYYLCHAFKDVTGLSIIDFINKKRLIESERLIKYSDMSITQIASYVGFNSVSYFITLFNKKYGCTPNSMKKKCALQDINKS